MEEADASLDCRRNRVLYALGATRVLDVLTVM
jgi:hypothetical protein